MRPSEELESSTASVRRRLTSQLQAALEGSANGVRQLSADWRFPTGWARTRRAAAVRSVVHTTAIAPVLRAGLNVDAYGAEELDLLAGPVLIVANHSSHLDVGVLLDALPRDWRQHTAVAVGPGYFDAWWRGAVTALLFNTFPAARPQEPTSAASGPIALLEQGWNVVLFPEDGCSPDGFVGSFHPSVGALAEQARVAVVPVGVRGTYAAMPPGRSWPARGRPRVSVRFGEAMRARAGEGPEEFTDRLRRTVVNLIAEDETSWWRVQRAGGASLTPPTASWRRIWQQSEEPTAGGRPRRVRIWRS